MIHWDGNISDRDFKLYWKVIHKMYYSERGHLLKNGSGTRGITQGFNHTGLSSDEWHDRYFKDFKDVTPSYMRKLLSIAVDKGYLEVSLHFDKCKKYRMIV